MHTGLLATSRIRETCIDFGTGLSEIVSVLALTCPVASIRILPALKSPLESSLPTCHALRPQS